MRRSALVLCALVASACGDYGTEPNVVTRPQFDHTTPAEPPATINVNKYSAEYNESGLKTFYKGREALFNGGIAYGSDGSNVHFVNMSNGVFDIAQTGFPVQTQQPGALADYQTSTLMTEQPSQLLGLKNELGIITVRETFSFTNAADEDYMIVKYSLTNTTSAAISNLHVGYMADPDVQDLVDLNANAVTNIAFFDAATQSARVRSSNAGQTQHAIISLSEAVGGYRAWRNGPFAGDFPQRDPKTNAEWFSLMSAGVFSAPFGPADMRQYVGTVPTVLGAGETKVYAFALVGGDNAADLSTNIAAARAKAGLLTAPVSAVGAGVDIRPGTSIWTARISFASEAEASTFNAANARCGGAPVTSSARAGTYVDVAFGALELDSRRISGAAMHCAGILSNGKYFTGTDYPTFTENSIPATRLTNNGVADFGATWSPDGSRIAFASTRDGGGIFTMDPAVGESSVQQLTTLLNSQQPTWSVNGTIAFSQGGNIRVMPATGGTSTILMANGTDPRYSPDGSRILFRRGNFLMVMDADGTDEVQIGGTALIPDLYGEWVSNTKIIFTRIAPGDEAIFSMEVGLPTTVTRLTPAEPSLYRYMDMTADGETLVFTQGGNSLVFQDMQSGLHTILFTSPATVANTTPAQANVEFAPDGKSVLFVNGNGLGSELFLVNLPQPATPAERAQELSTNMQSLIAEGLVSPADGAQLMDKLNTVAAMVADGRLNTAVNHVNSFINKVNALVNSRRLNAISGQQLTSEANNLVTQLQAYQP